MTGASGEDHVAHDWMDHGRLPSGRTRWSCRKCAARTTRATDPPVTGAVGRCTPGAWSTTMLATAVDSLEGQFKLPKGAVRMEVPPALWDDLVAERLTDGNNDSLWGTKLCVGVPGRVTIWYAREAVQAVVCRFAAGVNGPVRLGVEKMVPGLPIPRPDMPWRMWIGRKASPRAMDVLGWDDCGRRPPPGTRWAVITGWEPGTPGPGGDACLILCENREEAVGLAPLAGGTAVFGMFDPSRAA